MNEEQRNEIIRRHQQGASIRRIAEELRLSRQAVQNCVRRWNAQRTEATALTPAARRPSLLDAHDDTIRQLLSRYPDMTAVRVCEELRGQGFAGHYSIVRDRVRQLRPSPAGAPVVRFETSPGLQAQMD